MSEIESRTCSQHRSPTDQGQDPEASDNAEEEEEEASVDSFLLKETGNDDADDEEEEELDPQQQVTSKSGRGLERPHRADLKEWLFVGSTVLGRWKNGLYYLGVIERVEAEPKQCLVRYEDDSAYWTEFKDLHKQLSVGTIMSMSDSDILCTICRDGTSEAPNEIVICDVCNQGYHQRCHRPKIASCVLEPDAPWSCRLCVFALGTKEGGAEKNTPIGEAMRQMKLALPYDLQELVWDESHQVNTSNCYCYCAGPGDYYSKMLQCHKCFQWFHEACIQVLGTPLLYGDHYYTFTCGTCNKGRETIKRIIMKWSDMIGLVLNNLALQKHTRFFDLKTEIVPFVKNNCHLIKLSEDLRKLREEELEERVVAVLRSNHSKFINGKEVKRKTGSWALRQPFPFSKPLIFAPPFAVTNCSPNSRTLSSPGVMSTSATLAQPPPSIPSYPLMYGACRKGASYFPKPKQGVSVQKGRSNSVTSNSSTATTVYSETGSTAKARVSQRTCPSPRKRRDPSSPTRIRARKTSRKYPAPVLPSDSSDLTDLDALSSLPGVSLEAVIPAPDNFEGENNPFFHLEETVPDPAPAPASESERSETKMADQLDDERYRIIRRSGCSSKLTIQRINLASKKGRTSQTSSDSNLFKTSSAFESYLDKVASCVGKKGKYNVLARRVTSDGKVEYLLEWEAGQ